MDGIAAEVTSDEDGNNKVNISSRQNKVQGRKNVHKIIIIVLG